MSNNDHFLNITDQQHSASKFQKPTMHLDLKFNLFILVKIDIIVLGGTFELIYIGNPEMVQQHIRNIPFQ